MSRVGCIRYKEQEKVQLKRNRQNETEENDHVAGMGYSDDACHGIGGESTGKHYTETDR